MKYVRPYAIWHCVVLCSAVGWCNKGVAVGGVMWCSARYDGMSGVHCGAVHCGA